MKKILCITGTRADFGKLKPLLNYIEQHENLELHLVITGMHLLKTYGSTYLDVIREGYKNFYLSSNQAQNEPMCSVFGNTITQLSRLNDNIQPDMIIVHGDRLEALAGASVGALNSCLVCHIEGGELSGTIDDSIRHSISKLAHIHMVANESAVNRLLQMGENKNNIFVIGSPDLDVMLSKNLPSLSDVKLHYEIPFSEYCISLFHPVTTEVKSIQSYAKAYFEAIDESGKNVILIYPNNDTGSEVIINEIKRISNPRIKIFPSLRFEAFLVLLKHSKCIVGNSSAGIREAPFYGVSTIDVGTRQNQRHFSNSIINVDYNKQNILDAINKAFNNNKCYAPDKEFSGTTDKSSVSRFSEIIDNPEIWNVSVQKKFIDL